MAHAAQINALPVRNARTGESFFAKMQARFEQYRLYWKTVNELNDLSNRELSDLGLYRSTVREAANKAVYGK